LRNREGNKLLLRNRDKRLFLNKRDSKKPLLLNN
jgi:hypothetical protein